MTRFRAGFLYPKHRFLFSAVTPFGNPQNLYLYTYFKIPAPEFFGMMLPFGLLGTLLLCIAVPVLMRGEGQNTEKQPFTVCSTKLMAGALAPSVLFGSAAVSQVISNVPAAVLLSGFTPHYRELLYGVSAGGLGTLIASLASLISYKLYIKEFATEKRRYLKYFLILNGVFLVLILLGIVLLEYVLQKAPAAAWLPVFKSPYDRRGSRRSGPEC